MADFLWWVMERTKNQCCYVENVAAFIRHALTFKPGINVYNYVDKPDFTMNELVTLVRKTLNKGDGVGIRIPYWIGAFGGSCLDLLSKMTGKTFPISKIRVEKFCADTVFDAKKAHSEIDFTPPKDLVHALHATLVHEFDAKK